jgi:hypothetical protein
MATLCFDCGYQTLSVIGMDMTENDILEVANDLDYITNILKCFILRRKVKTYMYFQHKCAELNEKLKRILSIKFSAMYKMPVNIKSSPLEEKVASIVTCMTHIIQNAKSNNFNPETILVEFQMGINVPTREIATAIMTYFSMLSMSNTNSISNANSMSNTNSMSNENQDSKDVIAVVNGKKQRFPVANYKIKIKTVDPSIKKLLCLGDNLQYSTYAEKYSCSYTANKAHARDNFIKFLELTNQTNLLEDISSSKIHNLADAFVLYYVTKLMEFTFI